MGNFAGDNFSNVITDDFITKDTDSWVSYRRRYSIIIIFGGQYEGRMT